MSTLLETIGDAVGLHFTHKCDSHLAAKYPLKILVVEDMAIAARVLQSMLHSLGYDSLMAHDGHEAIEIYQEEFPHFVLMDVQMPEMDGITATVKIRQIETENDWPRSFITALTSDSGENNRAACYAAGMDDFISKPTQKSQLCHLLIAAHEALASA